MAIIPFVTRINPLEAETWRSAIAAAMPEHRIVMLDALTPEERTDARVAIVANPDPAALRALPNLVWVQSLWAGVERLLLEDTEGPYAIVRMTDPQLAATMAEAVLTWTLYLHRDMPAYLRQQAAHEWRQLPVAIAGERRVSIAGIGTLGRKAANALLAQGFIVNGWNRSASEIEGVQTFSGDDGLRDMLRQTDILVILLPLTNETRHIINDDTLALLPKGASVINFARGPIIDDAALLRALDARHIDHAVLDVFATEPLPADNPYWAHPHVSVLPHISAPTNPRTASLIAAHNILAYLETGSLPASVDRQRGY